MLNRVLNSFLKSNSLFKKHYNDFYFTFFTYSLSFLLMSFAKGQIYFFLAFIILIIALFIQYKELSFALFQSYLISLLVGLPFLVGKDVKIQEVSTYMQPIFNTAVIEVPFRFILFLFFSFSLILSFFFLEGNQIIEKSKAFISCFLTVLLIILMVNFGQLFGNYVVSYMWPTFHLIQILAVFPAASIFLTSRFGSKEFINRAKVIFFTFILFALFAEGLIAGMQMIVKSPLHLKIERDFTVDQVKAPENNMFRSPGTTGHPNSLGIMMSTLLPLGFWAGNEVIKLNKKNNGVSLTVWLCWILGFIGLILSFSRWSWISFSFGLILILLLSREKWSALINNILKNKIKMLIFLFLVPLIVVVVGSRFKRIDTLKGRSDVANIYVKMILTSPMWGKGPENSPIDLSGYKFDNNKYQSSLKGAHNTLLLVTADNGIPVGALWAIFYLISLVHSINHFRSSKKNTSFNIFLIYLIPTFSIHLMNTLAYPIYTYDANMEIFFLITAFFFLFSIDPKSVSEL